MLLGSSLGCCEREHRFPFGLREPPGRGRSLPGGSAVRSDETRAGGLRRLGQDRSPVRTGSSGLQVVTSVTEGEVGARTLAPVCTRSPVSDSPVRSVILDDLPVMQERSAGVQQPVTIDGSLEGEPFLRAPAGDRTRLRQLDVNQLHAAALRRAVPLVPVRVTPAGVLWLAVTGLQVTQGGSRAGDPGAVALRRRLRLGLRR